MGRGIKSIMGLFREVLASIFKPGQGNWCLHTALIFHYESRMSSIESLLEGGNEATLSGELHKLRWVFAAAIDGGKPLDLHQSMSRMVERKANALISHTVWELYGTKYEAQDSWNFQLKVRCFSIWNNPRDLENKSTYQMLMFILTSESLSIVTTRL